MPIFESESSTLAVVALAWRERWTGVLVITTSTSVKRIPFKNGGPTRLSDFNVINARAPLHASFEYCAQSGRGDWASTGGLLLRLGQKHPLPIDWERVRLDLTPSDARHLDLPEALVRLTERAGAMVTLEELNLDLDGPLLPQALARLGFLVQAESEKVKTFTETPVAGLLRGSGDLSRFLDEEGLLEMELHQEQDPQAMLVERVRAYAASVEWDTACRELSDYVGPVDLAELAAWRALVAIHCTVGERTERMATGATWLRLARRLPQSEEGQRLIAQGDLELSELRETQWGGSVCA